jgi:hypothetical protein
MPSDEWACDRGVEYRDMFRRPIPRCYLRPEVSQRISESRVDIESNVVLIGLSLITCVAAFLVLSGGLIF